MTDMPEPKTPDQFSRRDILRVSAGLAGAAGVIGAVGGAAFVVPRLERAQPDASGLVRIDVVDVDLAPIAPGQQIMMDWGSWPVFTVRRHPEARATLQHEDLRKQRTDPDSRERQQPPYADNWGRSARSDIAVLVGVCTHMGCIPQFHPLPNAREPEPDWLGGYLCVCHGSEYEPAAPGLKGRLCPYKLRLAPHR